MGNTGAKKREVRPLGVIALVMAIIYTIPVVLMFFIKSPVMTTIGLAAIPIALISYSAAKNNFWKTPATNVRISYLGHMCFKLECDGQTVIIDPYDEGSVPGLRPVKEKAEAVFYTGNDRSGNGSVKIRKNKRELPFKLTEYETADGRGKMIMLDNGDHRIVHLGALNCDLTDEQVEAFKGADVLMIPIGGKYTLDEEDAAELTLKIEPEYVIPMHFRAEHHGLRDISSGPMFVSNLRTGWARYEENEGRQCPVTVKLAARNGKEQGLSSVEVRNRDEAKQKDK